MKYTTLIYITYDYAKLYKLKSHNISINVAKIGIKIPCLEHGSYFADKDVTCSL